MKKIDWIVWKPRLLYGGFAVVAFVLALRWTFPGEAVKERLILEAGARGWQIEMSGVGPGGVLGFTARDVVLEDAAGLRIPLDSMTASLRILPLLTGKRVVAFDARAFEGRIVGTAALSGDTRPVEVTLTGVNLAAAPPLKRATGLDLAGTLAGQVSLELPAAASGKPSGRIDLSIADAGVNGGKVPIPGFPGDGLPLQKVSLGQVTANVKLDGQGKAIAEKLQVMGGDAELTGDGLSITLQPKLEYSPLFGKASLRLKPSFWEKSGMAGLQSLAEQGTSFARRPDGSLGLQVVGSLGHPRVNLAK
jgi:type II secretion system protein N